MVEEQTPEEQTPEVTEFIIGLSPRARTTLENLINAGLDWHVALLQLTCWIEPVFLDIEQAEPEPEPEQAEPEQTSQN